MDVFMYQAALYCFACGERIGIELNNEGKGPKNPGQENKYPFNDSEHYPQGPYPDGGGEADSPQHCDACHIFLENPLTTDGYTYIIELIRENICNGRGNKDVLTEWVEHYNIKIEDLMGD